MKKLLFTMIVCAIAAMGANAQKNAIAVVDMNYILKNVPAYESATEQLNQVSLKWKKEIDASAAEAKSMYENYQTELVFLSKEMQVKKENEIVEKENATKELKRKYFGEDGELFKKREALIKPIQDDIYAAIQELANEKKIDIVRDRSADPALIYMSGKLDISDQVLEKLGAK